MKWTKRSPHSIASGEYVISRATVQGSDMFTLWCGTTAVSRHDTADRAKRAAKEQGQ